MIEKGQDQCLEFILEHNKCLQRLGFNISDLNKPN